MMSYIIRATCVFAAMLWSVSAVAQYNPYLKNNSTKTKKTVEAEKTAKKNAPIKKRKARPASSNATPPRPAVLEQTTAPEAFGGEPSQHNGATVDDRIKVLEKELESLRLLLARAGIQEDVASLSVAQREELGRLETGLQQLRADHKALIAAIDRGLAPDLVMTNLHTLEAEMAATQAEIAQIRTVSDDDGMSFSRQVEKNESRIASLESEVAALRQRGKSKGEDGLKTAENEDATPLNKLNELLPVEIFAFGDFMYVIQEDAPDDFAVGQLELDLTQDLIDEVTITAAIAYDSEAESIGLGAFTIDGRILGADESHLRVSKKIESLGMILGQFDVPFGIDYMSYASIDRRLVTGPIAVDETHGGWNDLGAQLYLMMPRLNAVLYGVNGYSYETIEVGAAENEVVFEHPTAMAIGGRVGVLPVEALEVGGSLATFFTSDVDLAQLLIGADVAIHAMDFEFKGEYIYGQQGLELDLNRTTHGMYGGVLYDFTPVFATARYSMVWPSEESDVQQLSLGTGVRVFENGEIRFEYSTNLESGGSMAFIQLAGGTSWQPSGMRR